MLRARAATPTIFSVQWYSPMSTMGASRSARPGLDLHARVDEEVHVIDGMYIWYYSVYALGTLVQVVVPVRAAGLVGGKEAPIIDRRRGQL